MKRKKSMPGFDCRGLLVKIDNHIIPLRTTECERQGPPLLPSTILKFNILRSSSATCLKQLFSAPIPQKHKR
jgi:hypothetical protein